MSDSRRIDQILAELDALRREVLDLKRRRPLSWVQNGGGGAAIMAVTPAGGIAARTDNTIPLTFPSATCFRLDGVTGNYASPAEEVTVYNMTNVVIAGQSLIQAKKIDGRWFVDVDNCGGAGLTLPTVTAPGA